MVATKSKWGSTEVRRAQELFERWRTGKQGRERVPAKLWCVAAKLCEAYSVHRVSRWLRLNYTDLQSRVAARSGSRHQKPEFVEYNLPAGKENVLIGPSISSAEYIVEAAGEGAQRIHVRGANAVEVAALVRALRAERVVS